MTNIPHPSAIHVDIAARNALLHLQTVLVQLQHGAVFHHGNVVSVNPQVARHGRVLPQVPQLAMYRNQELRPDEIDHQLHLFLRGVARDVNLGHLVIQHVGPALEKPVDDAVDHLLVAGNGMGRHDHRVPFLDA